MPAAVLLRAGLGLREERAHRRTEHVHRVIPVARVARLVAWTSIHRHAQSTAETEAKPQHEPYIDLSSWDGTMYGAAAVRRSRMPLQRTVEDDDS